jgi:hypothetical protein
MTILSRRIYFLTFFPMENSTRYFKGPVGHYLSDGKNKVRFAISIIAVTDKGQIRLLENSKRVTECSAEDAAAAYPDVYKLEGQTTKNGKKSDGGDDQTGDNDGKKTGGEPSRKELEEEGKKLGLTEKEMKKERTNADLAALIADKKAEAGK